MTVMLEKGGRQSLDGLQKVKVCIGWDEVSVSGQIVPKKGLFGKLQNIVEEAAAMYYTQRRRAIGWVSEVVGNVQDLFNGNGDPYLYNVEFELSEPPRDGIPGFTLVTLAISVVGTAAIILLSKRK